MAQHDDSNKPLGSDSTGSRPASGGQVDSAVDASAISAGAADKATGATNANAAAVDAVDAGETGAGKIDAPAADRNVDAISTGVGNADAPTTPLKSVASEPEPSSPRDEQETRPSGAASQPTSTQTTSPWTTSWSGGNDATATSMPDQYAFYQYGQNYGQPQYGQSYASGTGSAMGPNADASAGAGTGATADAGAGGAMPPVSGPGMPGNGQGAGRPGGWNNGQGRSSAASRPWVISIITAVLTAVIVIALGYVLVGTGLVSLPQSASTSSLASSSGGSGTVRVNGEQAPDWTAVNKKVSASVVSITVQLNNGIAKGSGAILDTNGDIVTNDHVIEDATAIEVTLNNGNMYNAKVVGTDPTTDLAVIKLENAPTGLQPVTFANSSDLAVGERVMSIGNPLGYENTATTGIVSALNRPVEVSDETEKNIVTNAVQISAAINPGNSGGPTFDAAGQVIGINSSIATMASADSSSGSQSGSIGIGFAIPSNLVKKIADEIMRNGKATHAEMGITITTGAAEANGATRMGAKVMSVTPGAPGADAGLRKGDLIIGFNGNTVTSVYSLLGYVRAASVGETVKLTIIRDGKVFDLNCVLNKVESLTQLKANANTGNSDGSGNSGNGSGSGNGGGLDGFGLLDPFGLF